MVFMSFIKKGVATLNGKLPKRTKSDFRDESHRAFINFPCSHAEKSKNNHKRAMDYCSCQIIGRKNFSKSWKIGEKH